MPAWWGRKSGKNKEEQRHQQLPQPESHGGIQFNFIKSPIRNGAKKGRDKPKSFDEVSTAMLSRSSPRTSRDLTPTGAAPVGGSSLGFSCFDSDGGGEKIGLPLPRPSISSPQSFGNDQGDGDGLGSASISGSSVSSSGSCDHHPISQFDGIRGRGDMKINMRSKSPGPGSRGPTSPTSPLHPRLHALSIDSPTGKQDDGRSECHPLPLPPGSPTSPSALSNARTNGLLENTINNLSKWKKGKLLGRGTFGHVYLGFNSESGQMCAIKEVRVFSDDQTSKECLKQLNQEINLLSSLSHPNIVEYHGSELGEDTLSVYLEYVSGGSIHKLLQEYGPFKEPVIQNYVRQIVSGLAYLHGRNTVHRDIKGANILVDPNGEIKLADFGMAKHQNNQRMHMLQKLSVSDRIKMLLLIKINSSTSMLSFKGSPYWMAPEVVMNTNGYNLAVDIWSLGCTILEMATSKPPWSQYEGVAAIFKIGNSRDMPEIPEHLSNDAKSFIQQCLQRDPSARPTAQRLLEHPFIRDQSATRADIRDAFPYMFDGSRTPPHVELHSSRTNMTSVDGDYGTKPTFAASRALRSPRDNARMITSLPVSPCSSPLRQHGSAYKSCMLSPPHPTYNPVAQSSYNFSDLSSYPVRSNATFTLDPWNERSPYNAHTPPGGSPRRRLI